MTALDNAPFATVSRFRGSPAVTRELAGDSCSSKPFWDARHQQDDRNGRLRRGCMGYRRRWQTQPPGASSVKSQAPSSALLGRPPSAGRTLSYHALYLALTARALAQGQFAGEPVSPPPGSLSWALRPHVCGVRLSLCFAYLHIVAGLFTRRSITFYFLNATLQGCGHHGQRAPSYILSRSDSNSRRAEASVSLPCPRDRVR